MPQEGQIASAPGKPTLVYTGGKWRPQGSQSGGMTLGGPDPYKVEDQQMQREASARAAAEAERANFNSDRNFNQTQANQRVTQAAAIRQDFNSDPDVKVYKSILPTYVSALHSPPTPAGDLGLVFAMAKIMAADGSAVREGEVATAENVQNWVDKIKAQYGKQVNGDGTFLEGPRQQIREAMAQKMANLNKAFIAARVRYKDTASREGINPLDVVGDHPGIPFQNDEAKFLGHPVHQADYRGNVIPSPSLGDTGPQLSPQARGTAMGTTQTEIAKGGQESVPVPPAILAGVEGYLRARRGSQVDNQDFAAFYNDLAKRNSYPGGTPESLNAYIKQFNETGAIGPISPAQNETSALQQGYNQLAMTPWGTRTLRSANALGGGIPELLGGQQVSDGLRELSTLNPKSALAGDVFGGVVGTVGLGKGLTMAGLSAPKALTLANLGNSTLFGAAQNPENRLKGAAIGFGAGAVGDAAGGYIAAPALEALGRKPVNMALQAFGKQPLPVAPNLSGAERTIVNTVGGQGRAVTNMLGDASSLGLPMTLADTTEGLRSLAGATARRSPLARDMARNVMEPRALGQIDRLQGALSRDFGDPTNVLERSDALLKQAQTNSAPLYQEAFSAPGASSVETGDILGTPSGKQALMRARTQMLNDRKDPTALGIDINDAGEPVLTRVPSFETLDYVKKGFDDIANEGRTPFGTFQPNAEQSSAASLASDLRGRIDEVNPAYGAARAEYAGPAGERQALTMGKADVNKPAESVAYTLKNMPATRQDQYRLGQLSGISEQANKARYSANPYDVIAGSPEAQKRLSVLFPENAARFINQADLERQMAQSRNQILGGSPTALNQRADQAFDVPLGATLAIDGASAMLTGAPPMATGARLFGGFAKDAMKLGIGKKKAEALAPLLFSPDAATSAAAFQELSKNARRANVFGKAAKRRRGIFGGVTGGAAGAGATSEMQ